VKQEIYNPMKQKETEYVFALKLSKKIGSKTKPNEAKNWFVCRFLLFSLCDHRLEKYIKNRLNCS
jgi:hypothetical protein